MISIIDVYLFSALLALGCLLLAAFVALWAYVQNGRALSARKPVRQNYRKI